MPERSQQQGTKPVFNPRDPDFIRDPYPAYRRLGRDGPIRWDAAGGYWLATGYELCASILKDRRFGRRYELVIEHRYGPGMMAETVFRRLGATMLMQEPPTHTRLRGLVSKAFTARRVERLRPGIRSMVAQMLDSIAPLGTMDVIRDFAQVLPVNVICDMLGIPTADRWRFRNTAAASTRMLDPVPMDRREIDEANTMFDEQFAYFTDLFALRRRDPADDLITALLHVEDEAGGLTHDELLANIWLLFVAGHETTRNLIGNGLLALHRHPGELARLRADASLLPTAVDELLRFDSPVQFVSRTAFEDVTMGEVRIAKDQVVLCLLGAANRDPVMFADPDRLDVGRPDVRPLSFGGGIHYCLGAQLTLIEGQEAFAGLIGRLPGLRLDDIDAPAWQPNFTIRGLARMGARW
ncbi:cytochrome P450 [Skermanella mucosa]|uniref:cytochrome P450 n=1 Tax=Skermanella mucosa TaxID=1789672 RepID=UPI00192ABE92|nr:cytochrome P450 [Skermanella mucosa]UEM23738.1 cytochrome P450 [Skermanella mucosa]